MQIKINEKILSIPPYISTSWSHIAALHMQGSILVITMDDGNTIHITNLSKETIELIFNYHATYLEKENLNMSHLSSFLNPTKKDSIQNLMDQMNEPTIRLAFGSLEGMNGVMQHNSQQANSPDLPTELLQKISAITKIIAPIEETTNLKAEPDCNCFYCQIARAVNPPLNEKNPHEEVNDEELQFQQWAITQIGDHLFSVTNRLDDHEKYNVYLGQPVGCTCGKSGCEHILAVLKS